MKIKRTLIAFDPALHATGVAYFEDGELVEYFTLKVPRSRVGYDAIRAMWDRWDEVHRKMFDSVRFDITVTELQKHRLHRERSSTDNVIRLAGMATVFHVAVPAVYRLGFYPDQWKGTVPKNIHHARLQKKLPEGNYTPDELDAIGLGLYAIKKAEA